MLCRAWRPVPCDQTYRRVIEIRVTTYIERVTGKEKRKCGAKKDDEIDELVSKVQALPTGGGSYRVSLVRSKCVS